MTILFQLSSSEVGKSKIGGVIIRHIDLIVPIIFQINIPQVQKYR